LRLWYGDRQEGWKEKGLTIERGREENGKRVFVQSRLGDMGRRRRIKRRSEHEVECSS